MVLPGLSSDQTHVTDGRSRETRCAKRAGLGNHYNFVSILFYNLSRLVLRRSKAASYIYIKIVDSAAASFFLLLIYGERRGCNKFSVTRGSFIDIKSPFTPFT